MKNGLLISLQSVVSNLSLGIIEVVKILISGYALDYISKLVSFLTHPNRSLYKLYLTVKYLDLLTFMHILLMFKGGNYG